MKASVSPRALGLALAAVTLIVSSSARAQDVVVQTDGVRREGQILGLSNGQLKIRVGPVETSVPMTQVASVTKPEPQSYAEAIGFLASGNPARALETLKPIVDGFRGLPVPWVERGSAVLGDVYLALGKSDDAEAAYAAFQKAYPKSASLADLGLARLAIEKKDFATASAKLTPLTAAAEKVIIAAPAESAVYGQAFYLMGQIHEAEGKPTEALKDYLSAVTLFYEDQAVVAKARERADILMKDQQVIVP